FEAFAAINCLDYPLVTDEAAIRDFHERLEEASLFYTPAEGDLESGDVTCENWPVQSKVTEQRPVVGAGADPVLVVAVTNDPATPLKWAQAVAEQLESGVLLEFDGEGHIAYSQGDPCVVRAIDDYFISGTVPSDPTYC
ncbi:MAG: alpha/beta hydrolase, partial [Microbacteriaceae bacterium]|nr:alpha/beta hydrolase [Microbacteriaceae bacterium]